MRRNQMKQIWVSLFSVMVLLAFSPFAFAQGAPAAPTLPQAPTTSAMPDPKATEAGGAVKPEKKKKGRDADSTSQSSNKGGKLRGLDRADQVAGEHGQQGRENARARQGR